MSLAYYIEFPGVEWHPRSRYWLWNSAETL